MFELTEIYKIQSVCTQYTLQQWYQRLKLVGGSFACYLPNARN